MHPDPVQASVVRVAMVGLDLELYQWEHLWRMRLDRKGLDGVTVRVHLVGNVSKESGFALQGVVP